MTRRALSAFLVLCCVSWGVSEGVNQEPDTPRDMRISLRGITFDPLKAAPVLKKSLVLEPSAEPVAYQIIQFRRPLTREQVATLKQEYGLRLERYVHNLAYLEKVSPEALERLKKLEIFRWAGPYQPAFKLDPQIGKRKFVSQTRAAQPGILLMVVAFPEADSQRLATAIKGMGFAVEHTTDEPELGVLRFVVRVQHAEDAELIARRPDVEYIEEVGDITLNNGTTSWVIQTNVNNSRTIWGHGLRGEGQVIGHIDGALDINHCFFRDDTDNTVRPDHRKVVGIRNAAGGTTDQAHGTHTAGNAVGEDVDNDAYSSAPNADNGNAPRARITHGYLYDLDWIYGGTVSFINYLTQARDDGAVIHTNSWDDKSTSAYTQLSVDLDTFTWQNEDSLVIIGPNNNDTICPPDTSKNALVVNQTEQAPNQNTLRSGITEFTLDGRRKPDLTAPGCTNSADAGTVCGLDWGCGTSYAAPSVAGAAALARQYYTEGWYPSGTKQPHHAFTPSGALLKAVLLNATVDMTNVAGYPDTTETGEGWGRLLLEDGLFFQGDARNLVVWDVRHAEGLEDGESRSFLLTTDSNTQPLKITLVWNEPPGVANDAAPVINDLDLEVTDGTNTFLGNVFNGGQSDTGGAADTLNNVEQVLINTPVVGTYTITVRSGTSGINQGPQGFALVATADTPEPPVPTGDQDTLVARVGISDVLGGAEPGLTTVQNLMTDLETTVSEASYGQATINPSYPDPVLLAHARSYYFSPSRNPLIEMAEEVIAKLVAADGSVFDRGTADPADDIDRLIIVLNDPSFIDDWATTGPWPYNLPAGLTRRISVSIQSVFNDPLPRFAHGMGHQLGLVDLYAHDNVVFAQAHVDEWDNMATPFTNSDYMAWSKERATWITSQGSTVEWIPRPAAGSSHNQTYGLHFLSSTASNRKAIAIGRTEGASDLADEDVFYWVEARDSSSAGLDGVLPETGVLVYYVNEDVPQGEGPVRILDDDLTTPHLRDAALEVNDSVSPAGTGLIVTVRPGTGGADRDIEIAYTPPEEENDVRITEGSPIYTSPDIWIDSQKDGFDGEGNTREPMDRGDQAVEGEDNRIYVRVSNPGPDDAHDFTIFVRVSEPYHTVGGSPDFDRFVGQLYVPVLHANDEFVDYVEWRPDEDGNPHSCVEVTIPDVFNDVNTHNNRAQQNLEEITSSTASPYEVVSYNYGLTNEEDHQQLYYFRLEGVPPGWTATLAPQSALLMAGARVDGTLTVQPPDDAPVCTNHQIQVTSWKPSGDTLVQVGGGTFQVDLRNRTVLGLETGVGDCGKGDSGVVRSVVAHGMVLTHLSERQCLEVTAAGCTNPPRPNEEIVVRYEHPSGYPIYRTVTTDAAGCYSDFLVVTEGGAWQVTAEYPGGDCSGGATSEGSTVGVALPDSGDADSDGLSDADEPQGDHDHDGTIGLYDPDSDNDGVRDGDEPPGDCDRDGHPNVVDPDSDNDGVPDGRDLSPCGGGKLDRRFRFSFHVGSAHPLTNLDRVADANIYAALDLGYRLNERWNLKGTLGLAQFTAESAALIEHPRFTHLSANAQALFATPTALQWYVEGGPGIYRPKSGSTEPGFNLGFGGRIPLNAPFDIEFGFDYHVVNTDRNSQFYTLHLGVLFR